MFGTTDGPAFWRRIFGHPAVQPERYLASWPHLHADAITTPLLIIHGDRDYRVPIGEALRMWADLSLRGKGRSFCTSPMKTTGFSSPETSASGTRPSSRSWRSTCWVKMAATRAAVKGAAPRRCRDVEEFYGYLAQKSSGSWPAVRTWLNWVARPAPDNLAERVPPA
jgi:hypothetical protein